MYPIVEYPTKCTLLLFIASLAALSIGGWMYVIGRPNTYIYGLCHAYFASDLMDAFPDFVLYSLPDGLWSLSSILMLHPILRNEPLRRRLAIIAVVPMLGIISELLQGIGCMPGVFDICDLAAYAIPLMSYLFIQIYYNLS